MSLLNVSSIHGGYGGANILNGVDITLEAGEIGVIVGPNGAGKSTSLKAIFGLLPVTEGHVSFNGVDITNAQPQRLVAAGIAFVPQERNIFETMTVAENLEMGAFTRQGDLTATLARIYEIFPPLKDKRKQPAGELSGGQRQMVAIARALMIDPKLLLLDEPTAGLSPLFVAQIFERIIEISQSTVGVLLVEQNARQALEIATRGFVLASGQNRYTDSGANLLADPEVAKSFLGG